MTTPTHTVSDQPDLGRASGDEVPVEHRWAGLDRRLIPGTLGVAAVVLLWAVIVPWIASALEYDETVEAGTVIEMGNVSFTPTPGWEIDEQSGATAVLHHQGVTFSITVGTFRGDDLGELLSAANELTDVTAIAGPQHSVTTDSGLVGLGETFDGPNVHGSITVFADDTTGISVVAEGPKPAAITLDDEIDAMIRSISIDGGAT